MTQDEMIAANARLVIETMSGAAGFDLGYDEASLGWVSGFIDRQREGWLADGSAEKMRSILGSYAGAVVIAQHGGAWVQDDGGLAVEVREGFRMYPLNKVGKHIEHGEEDAIIGWYQVIGPMLSTGDADGTAR